MTTTHAVRKFQTPAELTGAITHLLHAAQTGATCA